MRKESLQHIHGFTEGGFQQRFDDRCESFSWRGHCSLRSRNYFPHGREEVPPTDADGLHIQQEFLGGGIDLGVASAQGAQSCFCTHCFDVCAAVTWQHRKFFKTNRLLNVLNRVRVLTVKSGMNPAAIAY